MSKCSLPVGIIDKESLVVGLALCEFRGLDLSQACCDVDMVRLVDAPSHALVWLIAVTCVYILLVVSRSHTLDHI